MALINLGKVKITFNGLHDKTKEYDELCIVDNEYGIKYISLKKVPVNTELSNTEYWKPLSGQFVELYQGVMDTEPTTRLDGTALKRGDLYFDSNSYELRVYDGSQWKSITAGSSYSKAEIDEKFESITTPEPSLTIDDSVNENAILIGSFSVSKGVKYVEIKATKGTIQNINFAEKSFVYLAPNITDDQDTTDTIFINAYKDGYIVSNTVSKTINVLYVPMNEDDAISNSNFKQFEYNSKGVIYA